eukprot:g78562.t1
MRKRKHLGLSREGSIYSKPPKGIFSRGKLSTMVSRSVERTRNSVLPDSGSLQSSRKAERNAAKRHSAVPRRNSWVEHTSMEHSKSLKESFLRRFGKAYADQAATPDESYDNSKTTTSRHSGFITSAFDQKQVSPLIAGFSDVSAVHPTSSGPFPNKTCFHRSSSKIKMPAFFPDSKKLPRCNSPEPDSSVRGLSDEVFNVQFRLMEFQDIERTPVSDTGRMHHGYERSNLRSLQVTDSNAFASDTPESDLIDFCDDDFEETFFWSPRKI